MRSVWHNLFKMVLVSATLIVGLCGCQNTQPTRVETTNEKQIVINQNVFQDIEKRGKLVVGVKMDVPDLSFYDEKKDEWSGLEVSMAYKTAAKIFGVSEDAAKDYVQFVGVTVADREERLINGDIDCMMATYTITKERAEKFALSDSYYSDYIGIMVLDEPENNNSLGNHLIESTADLDGKYIGVPRNATTRDQFLNYIDTMNTMKVSPIFCEYASYAELYKALHDGNIDAMAVDVSILNGYLDETTQILGDRFGKQEYGVAVLPENQLLLDIINEVIREDV